MKRIYLILAIIGFILPNYFVFLESIETGNIMLYGNISDTLEGMFANRISTIFIIDLLFGVIVFFLWSFYESKEKGIKNLWQIWVLTILFGLAGGFPLFLYFREKKIHDSNPKH